MDATVGVIINTLPSSMVVYCKTNEYLRCVCFFLRQSRQALTDINTEPSQSEQIIWDDPTAREERARLVSNLQWPNSPSQYTEHGQSNANKKMDESAFKGSLADAEIAGIGKIRNTISLFFATASI